jgi:hypothetical protein
MAKKPVDRNISRLEENRNPDQPGPTEMINQSDAQTRANQTDAETASPGGVSSNIETNTSPEASSAPNAVEEPPEAPPEAQKDENQAAEAQEPSPVDSSAIVLQGEVEGEAPPRRPGWLKRFLAFWFNPDSKLGRFNRSMLRWTAFISGFFALGMLSTYLLLYRPTLEQQQALNASLERSQKALMDAQVDLLETRQKVSRLEESEKTARSELERSQNRLLLLQWLNQTNAARAAVARRDGTAALDALRESRSLMEKLYPVIKNQNASQADALKALLDLAQADLARDTRLVQEDLDRLLKELTLLDQQMYAKP